MKKFLAENEIEFYTINATKIAMEIGLGSRTNTIMQSAFFKVSEVIPYDDAIDEMKKAIQKTYGKKGDVIVKMNYAAVDRGAEVTRIKVPAEWANINVKIGKDTRELPDFIKNIFEPINKLQGDNLPVSAFNGREDGTFPAGTTAFEKRGVAANVPEWLPENCIQCNQCSYVCPHACIRPFLLDEKEMKGLPKDTATLKAIPKTFDGYQYRMQVSPLDCTGCGNCVEVCPTKVKALVFQTLESQMKETENWDYLDTKVTYKDTIVPKDSNVKNSQFAQPLFEFSGACAGCGETSYIKLVTQLFGERMMIANATGCSSIYGGSAPSTPYSPSKKTGRGPAWANSLFEDNAEYGFGMVTAIKKMRNRVADMMRKPDGSFSPATKDLFNQWLESMDNGAKSDEISLKLIPALEKEKDPMAKNLLKLKQYFSKKSVWVIGGDGWAYDIGYGGLDHVLASGDDINVLVLDTEVYSNTGGQASKSTPTGAVAKFAASGKKIRKKDLGAMAMTYGYVYVAQVAMGASQSQLLKAIREAEAYHGPSLIIAYAPCINHGLRFGMSKTQEEEKLAVECGYWHLYRFNPELEKEGKNPFTYDSKDPDWSKFQDFLGREVRYTSLKKSFPMQATELFAAAEENAKWRYKSYQRMSAMEF